ncbi:NitT/TauT family transport system substrate-binding protein [uncultured Thiomicrorhabdus sp.]|jgi:NitT/TauT family transport system substrate-binding protein|nr:ABC transporter substrate-binding protein [Thiomicrorhabdus marina]
MKSTFLSKSKNILAGLALSAMGWTANAAEPLKIGYSDWPGWVAWEVAVEKDWFAKEGVDVQFEWFDYVASMDAFAAGQLDAVGMTNGDALVTGSTGAPSVMIAINDYSNGNDMVVAQPGISSIKDLKGKKIGVEVGFVGHLLLLTALEENGMQESDVTLVNVPTNETPQVLASGEVDAIVAWQPSSGQALKMVPGSTAVFTSADKKGIIYDGLSVNPASLAARHADWEKVVKVWYQAVGYIQDPKTRDDALKIMSSRVGLTPEEYAPFLEGTKLLTLEEAKAAYKKGTGLDSIFGSSKVSDDFNVNNKVYDTPQDVNSYFDGSITEGM